MATKATKINVKAFNALKVEIAELYDGVIKLDQKLNGTVVKKFYDLARGVNQFVNAFSKLQNELKGVDLSDAIKSVEGFFGAIQTLDEALRKTGGDVESSPIVKFSNALYRLTLSVQEIKFDGRKVNALVTNLGKIASIPNTAPMAPDFDQYLKSLRRFIGVKDLFEALNKIQFSENDSFAKITKFFTSIITLTESTKDIQINENLSKLVTDVSDLLKAFAQAGPTGNLGGNIVTMQAALSYVRNFFIDLGNVIENTKLTTILKSRVYFPQLISIVDPVFAFFERMAQSKIDAAKLTAVSDALSKALAETQVLFISVQSFVAVIHPATLLAARAYLGGISPIFESLANIFASVARSGMTPEKMTLLTNMFPAMIALFAGFGEMVSRVGVFGNLRDGAEVLLRSLIILPAIFKPLNGLFAIFKELPKTPKGAVGDLKGVFEAVLEIMQYLGDTFTFLTQSFNTVSSVAGLILQRIFVIGPFFSTFFKFLREISGMLRTLQGLEPGSVAALAGVFDGFQKSLVALSTFMTTLDTVFPGNFITRITKVIGRYITVRIFLGQIFNVISSITKVFRNMEAPKVEAIGGVLRGLGTTLKGLSDFLTTVASDTFFKFDGNALFRLVGRLIQIRLGLVPLGLVLKKLAPVFELSQTVDARKIAEFVQSLAAILKSITGLFALFGDKDYSLSFTKLAKMYLGLSATLKPLTSLSNLFKKLPTNVNLDGATAYLRAVMEFVNFATSFALREDSNVDPKFFHTLDNLFKSLNFKSLKNFQRNAKGVDALVLFASNLGRIFESIEKLPSQEALDRLAKADFSGLTRLEQPIRVLLSSLKDVTPKDIQRIEAIAKLLDIVPKTDKLAAGLSGSAQPATQSLVAVRDISDDVAKGILKADIIAGAFRLTLVGLGKVISLLNPIDVVRGFVEGFARIEGAVDNVRQAIVNTLRDIRELGESIGDFGTNVVDKFGIQNITNSDLFQSTVEFDKLGNSLEVFGGLTKEQRAEAEAFASIIGKDYPLSANEALSATLDLIKAGQNLESTKFILPAAADLASLSDSGSIENATGFIIQATAAFKDFNDTVPAGFENAAVAVDIIAAAADTSTASVEGLAEGLANVGPVASQFGLSLEDTAAVLAIFTDGGIAGAEAGTQLKSFLTSLTTDTAQKELRRLGVAIEDTATGKIRPLNDILNDIQDAFTKTSTTFYTSTKRLSGPDAERLKIAQKALAAATRQQILLEDDLSATALGANADKKLAEAQTIAENASAVIAELTGSAEEATKITQTIRRSELDNAESLKKIAGSYGQAGLAILLAQGEDGLKNFIDQMRAVEPASVRARKALDNIQGDMIQLQGSLETLGTKALAPLLEKFFRPFVQVARFVVDSFLSIDDSVIEFITTAITLGSALATVVGGVAVLGGGLIRIGAVGTQVVAFLGVMTKALTVGLIGAIGGLVAGLATLAAGFLIITPVLTLITTGFEMLSKIFRENLGGATTQFLNLMQNVGGALNEVGTAIKSILNVIVQALSGGELGSLDSVGAGIASFFNQISLSVTKFRTSGVGKTLTDVGAIFKGFYETMTLASRRNAAEKAAADTVDSARRIPAAAAEARKGVAKAYAELVLDLSKNNRILQSVFGTKNLSVDQVTRFFDAGLGIIEVLGSRVGDVFDSIRSTFSDAFKIFQEDSLGEAINFFFENIGTRLDSSLGDLAAEILKTMAVVFNFDSGDFSQIFDEQGFAAGISKLIGNALQNVGKFLLNNRNGIKGILTFVFEKLALGSLSLGRFLADLFGLENVSGIFNDAINTITGIFGGVIDTVFNVIGGQDLSTALLTAFGPGIQPVLDLIDSLGQAVDNIVGFISTIFSAIFSPPAGVDTNAEPPLLALFNGVVEGITGVIDFLNTNILNFLATGDIGGMITNLVNSVTTAVQGLDLPTKFADAAASILTGFVDALKSAFLTISDVLGFDGQAFLDDINAAMKTSIEALGDGATVFEVAVTAIQGLLVTAINGIFTGLGELLNIDTSGIITEIDTSLGTLVNTINNVFGGADGTSVFDNITTIVDKLVKAIKDLFAVFASPEASTAQSTIDPIRVALEGIVNLLGSIVDTTIDTFNDLIEGFDKLTAALALLSPAELLFFAGALGTTAVAIGLFAGGGAILTALGAGFTALGAGLNTTLLPLLRVVGPAIVFVQFIRAIAQNLDTFAGAVERLSQGDIIGAVTKAIEGLIGVFTDLAFNLGLDKAVNFVGNLLGIDSLAEFSREGLKKAADQLIFIFENAAKRAGLLIKTELIDPIANFVNLSLPLLLSGLEKARLQVKAGLGDAQAGLVLGIFDNIDATAGGNIDFVNTTEQQMADFVTDINKGGQAALDRLKGTVGLNFQPYFDKAVTDFGLVADDPVLKAEMGRKLASFFDLSGTTDDALALAAQSGNSEFFSTLLQGMLANGVEVTPELQKQFTDSIIASFNVLDPTAANASLASLDMTIAALAALELDTTYLEEQRAILQAQIDEFLATGTNPDGTTGTTVTTDVAVTPNVTTTPPLSEDDPLNPNSPNYVGKMLVKDEAGVVVPLDINLQPNWKNLEAADADQIVPTIQEAAQAAVDGIPAATPLVAFDSSALTDPTKVEEFNTLIGTLITNIQTLGTELGGVATSTLPVTTALTEISTAVTLFRDVNTPLFTEVGTAAGTIGNAIRDIQSALLIMFATATINFPIFALTASAAIGTIIFNFTLLKIAADTSLQSVVTKVRELAGAFKDASLAASTLSNSPAFAAAGGGGGVNPGSMGGGRASGGPVSPGFLYPFLEKKQPELLQMGNQTFLAVPRSGNVVPMTDISSSRSTGLYGSAPAGRAGGSAGGAGTTILIQQGDTTINIHGIDPNDARAIGVAIRREMGIVNNTSTNRLSEKLRTANR